MQRFVVCLLVFFSLQIPAVECETASAGVFFRLTRRGGRLARHEPANLTFLSTLLEQTEHQYGQTSRKVNGNKLARTWAPSEIDKTQDHRLLSGAGKIGRWFLDLEVGDPPQSIQVDLDMMSPDFYTLMTTSDKGSRYNVFSHSHFDSGGRVHQSCRHPSDAFHLPLGYGSSRTTVSCKLSFAMCNPHKSSVYTLLSSGTFLGLSPATGSLSRFDLEVTPLVDQLHANAMINSRIWSLTLLTADSGLLSLGDTPALAMESAKVLATLQLTHFGAAYATVEWLDGQVASTINATFPPETEKQFRWVSVSASAKGWWTVLMSGVWVSGSKILKNQPALLDVNCPFIIAPPLAARRFYDAIGGSKRLHAPYGRFWKAPCINLGRNLHVAMEFGGWMFPVFKGEGTREDGMNGPVGGRGSLGKYQINEDGTGYCVGLVVEGALGRGAGRKGVVGNGLQDTWVLGEPFFRGLGLVFDVEHERVGFRSY